MSKPLTSDDIIGVLREQKEFLHKTFYVKNIGIFGSFARNEANDDSDIDFLVELDAPLEIYISNRYKLSDYLQDIFKREVDLANPKSLKPFYKDQILKQAIYA